GGHPLHPRLPRGGRAVHLGAARPVAPRNQPAGQPLRHGRHGDRRGGDPAAAGHGLRRDRADPARARHRRRRRRLHRHAHPDDGVAAARGRVPLAGGHGGRVRGGGGLLRAGELRHRHARPHPRRVVGGDVAGARHRRHHLLRLRHRLRQAAGADERGADHLPLPALAEPGPGHPAGGAGGGVRVIRRRRAVLADRAAGLRAGLPAHHPDRRRGHAGGRLHAEQLLRLGGGGDRLHPRQPAVDRDGRAGRRLGRDPVLHHVQGDEPLHHQRAAGRLGHGLQRGGRGRRRRGRPRPGEGRQPGGRGLHHEERGQDHRRAWLRHGGGAGAAGAARDGRPLEEGRGGGGVRHPPRRRPDARPHERAAGRGQRALRRRQGAGGDQPGVRGGRRGLRDRRQRRDQPGRQDGQGEPDLRHADPGRGAGEDGVLRQARHVERLRRGGQRAVLPAEHHDALRRRQEGHAGDRAGIAAL
ncbi:MAG: NAD(P) transhydrogenase subunit beta, partial [uncultured Acetobacteraceae bacterium]